MKKGWTILYPREMKYIEEHYKTESANSMAKRFGVGAGVVVRHIKALGFKTTIQKQRAFAANAITGKTSFTTKEDAYIRKNYLNIPIKRLASDIGRSYTGVMNRINRLGLHLPAEVIERNRKSGQIKPGNIPPNKGRKMPQEMYKKCQATMFKKGQLPKNTLYDGAIVIRKDKRGVPQMLIRIKKAKWEYLSRYNYRKHIGPIPKGWLVVFRNGNTLDLDPANLECISKQENMRRNTVHNYPTEIKSAIITLSKLKKTINNAKE